MSQELENLVRIEKLKPETCALQEFEGYLKSGRNRLADASNEDLSDDSRFDLAYGAAHAFAIAALRLRGYRSEDRYIVFQVLPHTVGLESAKVKVFAKAHNERNLAEYQGRTEVDAALLEELILAAKELEVLVLKLDPPKAD